MSLFQKIGHPDRSLVLLDRRLNMLFFTTISEPSRRSTLSLPPFTFRALKMFFYVLKHSRCLFCNLPVYVLYFTLYFNVTELVERSTQNVGWGKFCAKRASKIVVPPKEMLLSFACVRFLTNCDVRERKQHINLTILCVLKTNFWTAIK